MLQPLFFEIDPTSQNMLLGYSGTTTTSTKTR